MKIKYPYMQFLKIFLVKKDNIKFTQKKIYAILKQNIKNFSPEHNIKINDSSKNKYQAITVSFKVYDKKHVECIYKNLTKIKQIKLII